MLPSELKAWKLKILEQCTLSTAGVAKVFFPDTFALPFSEMHRQAMAVIDDPNIKRIAILTTRGWGKTSIVQRALVARHALFGHSRFIVPISRTAGQSEEQLNAVKGDLVGSPIISKLGFKDVKTDRWAQDFSVIRNTAIMPRGYGQQVRGLLYKNDRPSLFIVDDLESAESVASDEQRAKVAQWFYSDVLGAVDLQKPYKIIYIGNMLHNDCLLANLINDPNWYSLTFPIADENFNSYWPEKYPNEVVLELRDMYQEAGQLDVFYREYMCQPMSKENAPFTQDCFHYYDETELASRFIETVVLVDPAKSTNKGSCDTAIVGVGIDAFNNRFYVRDLVVGRYHPNEVVDQAVDMCVRLKARVLGFEEQGSAEFISWPVQNELRRRAANIEYVKLTPRQGKSQYLPGVPSQGKEARISHALVGLYRNGVMYHNKAHKNTHLLEQQLLSFPNGKKDIVDALSYIAQIMERGERFFAVRRPEDGSPVELGPGRLDVARERQALAALMKTDRKYATRSWW